jgi:malate/lactate dehydrogenase
LGANGLEQVIELNLTPEENQALQISIQDVAENVEKLKAFV